MPKDFGSNIIRSPDRQSAVRRINYPLIEERSDRSEIGEFKYEVGVEEKVLRFNVAVHVAERMKPVDRGYHLVCPPADFVFGELRCRRAIKGYSIPKRSAGGIFDHHMQ
jgi:hypothetical protein